MRYPGKDDPTPQQGVGAHKDSGVLTLLWVEPGKGGLQVERDGEWVDAPPVPGAFVVNIGELLEYATQGYLIATNHRVISPRYPDDRISVPFFFNPALDTRLPLIELPAELAAEARGVTQDPTNPIHALLRRERAEVPPARAPRRGRDLARRPASRRGPRHPPDPSDRPLPRDGTGSPTRAGQRLGARPCLGGRRGIGEASDGERAKTKAAPHLGRPSQEVLAIERWSRALAAKSETLDQRAVTRDVDVLEVAEQTTALTDHQEQTTT